MCTSLTAAYALSLKEEVPLKLIGCLFLISGWAIALAALILLTGTGQRLGFVLAGLAVEALGLFLAVRNYEIGDTR